MLKMHFSFSLIVILNNMDSTNWYHWAHNSPSNSPSLLVLLTARRTWLSWGIAPGIQQGYTWSQTLYLQISMPHISGCTFCKDDSNIQGNHQIWWEGLFQKLACVWKEESIIIIITASGNTPGTCKLVQATVNSKIWPI